MTDETQKTDQVNRTELQTAHSGPAVFANRFVVDVAPAIVRIAMIETSPTGVPSLRCAVATTREDAQALANLLTTLLATPETQTRQ